MGCPAGIGPEIILKHFRSSNHLSSPPALVIGDPEVLRKTGRDLNLPAPIHAWSSGERLNKGSINVVKPRKFSAVTALPGNPDSSTGAAMVSYLEEAIHLCNEGLIGGITTCPISKISLRKAGYSFPGHTEFLAERTKSENAIMMMAGSRLRITLATIHCSLRAVPSMLSQPALEELIELTDKAMKTDFAIAQPRIAVAGLNPHGGEDGLFGCEEMEIIKPAVMKMRKEKILVAGPFPPDTIFYKAASGTYDVVICMYHDQGLIPFKLLHFSDGVNVTLGLPLVRTSVDHGTAYDIAGKGIADHASLTAAVNLAATITANRLKVRHKRNKGVI